MNETTIVAIVTAIITIIGTNVIAKVVDALLSRHRNKVDEAVIFSDQWKKLYDEIIERNKELEGRTEHLEKRLDDYEEMKRTKKTLEEKVEALIVQQNKHKDEIRRIKGALYFLMGEVAESHPEAVDRARRISRGEEAYEVKEK